MNLIDLSGFNCPLPVLKTKKYLATLGSGERLQIITTDPASKQDLNEFCNKTGHILVKQTILHDKIITIIQHK